MATNDKRLDDLTSRVEKLEEKVGQTHDEVTKSNLEYYKMITQAVSEAVNPLIEKMEEQNKRITKLEQADGDKSKLILKTIITVAITTTIGWIITGYLNNYVTITSDAIRNNIKSQEVTTNENNNN